MRLAKKSLLCLFVLVPLTLGNIFAQERTIEPFLSFSLYDVDPVSQFGYAVANAGDLNNDGIEDIIVGSPGHNNSSGLAAGRAYIFFGGDYLHKEPDLILEGNNRYGFFGDAVSGIGDINDDGYDDVLVGASHYNNADANNFVGKAYIFFGGKEMNAIPDKELYFGNANGLFGNEVSSAGDINNDGIDDFIVCEPNLANSVPGKAYLYYGNKNFTGIPNDTITGIRGDDRLGWSAATAGDVNGDGTDDLIAGALQYNKKGAAFIYFGGKNLNIPDVILTSPDTSDFFGFDVTSAGDQNNDGFDDVLVSSPNAEKVYLFYGGEDMDSIADITINGINKGRRFGYAIQSGFDQNKDGINDILIGEPGSDSGTEKGHVYLFYGGRTEYSIPDLTLKDTQNGSKYGVSLATKKHFTNDGSCDVMVGALLKNNAGETYLYYNNGLIKGDPDVTLRSTGNSSVNPHARFTGDINNDGYDDFLVSFPKYNNGTGIAFLFLGSKNIDTIPDLVFEKQNKVNNSGFGENICDIGDLNADGFDDILVDSFIYFGGKNMDNMVDMILPYAGNSTSGDFNHDGWRDILTNSNKVYLYYGSKDFDAIPDLIIEPKGYNVGIGCIGHLNDDEYDDFFIQYKFYSTDNPLKIKNYYYVFELYFGRDLALKVPDISIKNLTSFFGTDASNFISYPAGDINNDGYDDFAQLFIGLYNNPVEVRLYQGGGNVLSSPVDTIMISRDISSTSFKPESIDAVGDINNDGYDDLMTITTQGSSKILIGHGSQDIKLANSIYRCQNSGDFDGDHVPEMVTEGQYEINLYIPPKVTLTATNDKNSSIQLTWNNDEIPEVTKFSLFRNDIEGALPIGTNKSYIDQIELIPGYEYSYRLFCMNNNNDTLFIAEATGKINCNGQFDGRVISKSGGNPIEGVQVQAIRVNKKNPAANQFDRNPSVYSAYTDINGEYTISGIYYYDTDTFFITAKKGAHGFQPDTVKNQILKLGSPNYWKEVMDILDTTNLSISGRVFSVFEGDTCSIPDVTMTVSNESKEYKTQTGDDGFYSIAVDNPGEYTIKPDYHKQHFNINSKKLNINDNIEDINFESITKYKLSGLFTTSCKNYIGKATIRIFSDPTACIDINIYTSPDSGYFEILLPAARYNIEVFEFTSTDNSIVDADEVRLYFDTDTVNLLDGPVRYNFIYHKTPTISVDSDIARGCGDFENVGILNQGETYFMEVGVHEMYGKYACPCDTGYIIVEEGFENTTDTIEIKNGYATFDFVPGEPNVLDGGEHPYQASVNITANVMKQQSEYQQWMLINGNKPRDATFATVSPEIPMLILRDPPGDKSYSFISQQKSIENTLSFYTKHSASVSAWAKAKVSGKLFGVSLWGEVEGGFEVGAGTTLKDEYSIKLTSKQEISTSNEDDLVGEDADIYVAAAFNILYAITDVIQYNKETCTVDVSQDLAMGTDKLKTMTYYTGQQIKTEIQKQKELRDIYLQNEEDSAASNCENQISVWEQTLALNRNLKNQASFKESISFSDHAEQKFSSTITVTNTSSFAFDIYMDLYVAVSAGLKYKIIEGSAGVKVNTRFDFGIGASSTSNYERQIGYVLNDDDVGDYFWVNVLNDKVYGTPVFELVSGRSSCPWEPGTQRRDAVRVTSDVFTQYVDEDKDATFNLNFGNLSQSNENRWYGYMLLDNPYNARVTIGGAPLVPRSIRKLDIAPRQSTTQQMIVSRMSETYDHTLQIAMFPECEYSIWEQNGLPMKISDTVTLNVHFNSPCGRLSINSPQADWIANSNNTTLTVAFEGYAKDNTQYVALEYSKSGIDSWDEALRKNGTDLNNEDDKLAWDLSNVQDGQYFVRIKSRCTSMENYSDYIKGTIDRNPPAIFGVPQPSDRLLEKGDLIKVDFNEEINLLMLSDKNINMFNKNKNKKVDVQFGSSGKDLTIYPVISGEDFSNDTLSVEVLKIADMYGNTSIDTISWDFVVSGDDSFETDDDIDNDGIMNEEDNCQFTFNQIQLDLDKDGKGDACDDDVDGDGILNPDDNCPYMFNSGQEDADGNGVGDVCESMADGDKDGVINAIDNCVYISNADQGNRDFDSEGDVCDNDIDGDGIINILDNCPGFFNPDQSADDVTNGCKDINANVEELISEKTSFEIYPNPAEEFIWIEFNKRIDDQKIEFKIYSIDGKIWLNDKINYSQDKNTYKIPVNELKKGMYFIQVTTSSEIISGMFVVQ